MILKRKKSIIQVLILLMISSYIYAKPVRVVVFENTSYPDFTSLGCTNNQIGTANCRVYKKLNCQSSSAYSCTINESAIDNGNFGQSHATTVSKLVTNSNPYIDIISAKGDVMGVMDWIKNNYQSDNIKVLNRTDGGAPSQNQVCSAAQIYKDLYNRGVSITHSSGNQWANGLTYDPVLGYAPKGVTDASCAYEVLSIGASGSGLVKNVDFTPGGFQTKCFRPEPYYHDLPPKSERDGYIRVPIDCYSNAGPQLDYLAEPNGLSSQQEGTSFAAPKVAGLIANYHTQYPGRSISQVKSYLNSMSGSVTVNANGMSDTYKRLVTTNINNQLNGIQHKLKEGYWYNPERSGWGLYVAEKNNIYYLTWYTYDQFGKPVWYTTSGNFNGNFFSGSILKTRKLINSNPTNKIVGTLNISLINDQNAEFKWDFNSSEQNSSNGTERIEHISAIGEGQNGSYNGLWYNPLDGGWGMSTHFKNGFSGFNFTALYYYDSFGNPIWAVGSKSNATSSGTLYLDYLSGACPSCKWRPTTSTFAGTIFYNFSLKEIMLNISNPYSWPRSGETINQGWIDILNLTYE